MANSGTPSKIALDGIPYALAGDTNLTLNFSPYEKEGMPTTGETMVKYTLRNPSIEGVTLQIGSADEARLSDLSERLDFFPISVTLRDGTTYKTTGTINYENQTTEDGKATISIIPSKTIGAWTKFVA